MEGLDLNCSGEKLYCQSMADFATKVTKIHIHGHAAIKKKEVLENQALPFCICRDYCTLEAKKSHSSTSCINICKTTKQTLYQFFTLII